MNLNSRLDIPVAAAHRSSPTNRVKRESAEVCRERAATDLLASVSMLNDNQRLRMETSAAMWAERAEILQRVEDGLVQRTAETAARSLAAKEALRGDEDSSEAARA